MLEEKNNENSPQPCKPSTEATELQIDAKSSKKTVSEGGSEAKSKKERLSLKKSQEDKLETNEEKSGKSENVMRKLSRLSLIACPKAAAKSKFKECSQQSNLNAFVKVKSPKTLVDVELDEFDCVAGEGGTLKISSSLFGTPKRNKMKNKGKRGKEKKNLEGVVENLNETIVNDRKVDKIESTSEIATKLQETNQNISEKLNDFELFGSENNLNSQSDSENDSGKLNMNMKQSSLSRNNLIASPENSSDCSEISERPNELVKNNVFEFMMEQRHKSIGSNSPGKPSPAVEEVTSKDTKNKLQARKLKFEKWNKNKGGTQRNVEDAEKGVYINKVLKKRKRRLKKMLDIKSDSEDEVKHASKRKREAKSDSDRSIDSLNTSDSLTSKKKKLLEPIIVAESDSEKSFDFPYPSGFEFTKKKKLTEVVLDETKSDSDKSIDLLHLTVGDTTKKKEIPVLDETDSEKSMDLLNWTVIDTTKRLPTLIISDSSSSDFRSPKKKKLPEPMILDEAAEDEEVFKKCNKLTITPTQTGLLNFFGVLKKDGAETKTVTAKRKCSKRKRIRKISSTDDSSHSSDLKGIDNNSESSENVKLSVLKNRMLQKASSTEVESDNHESRNIVKHSRKLKADKGSSTEVETDETENVKLSVLLSRKLKVNEGSSTEVETSNQENSNCVKLSILKSKMSQKLKAYEGSSTEVETDNQESRKKLSTSKSKMSCKLKSDKGSSSEVETPLRLKEDEASSTEVETDEQTKLETIDLTDDEASRESLRRSSRRRKVRNYIEDSEDLKKESGKKMAPVFLKSLPKRKLDPAVAQARLEFLHSGVPSLLKRVVEKQQQNREEIDFDVFPSISHVQQRPDRLALYWDLDPPELEVNPYPLYEPEELPLLTLGCLTNVKDKAVQVITVKPPDKVDKSCLVEIKSNNLELPIYKIYRQFLERSQNFVPKPEKGKRGRKKKVIVETPVEDAAMWSEKYKPKLPDEVIGNRKSIGRFKTWLQNWIDYSQEKANKRTKISENSDSDFESTDGDSRDTRLPSNLMILSGPLGCGKSTTVYSVCNQMQINVIELNASSKRTGKKLLQEVQEATRSHQVRNKNQGLSSFIQTTDETQGAYKMCLLLIEDVDIVFEQDEGFISSLSQLISTSKRPVALLTSDLNCLHVQKFVVHNNSLKFKAISPGTSSIWLQVLCLAEGLQVDRASIAQLLQCNKGDLRRTLLQLQFWVQTGGDPRKYCTNYTIPALNLNDFAAQEDDAKIPDDRWVKGKTEIHHIRSEEHELSLGALWWNLPHLDTNSGKQDLERLSGVLETIAVCDSLNNNELEPCYKRWETDLKNGLSLSENMQSYKNCCFVKSLTQTLVQGHCKFYKTDVTAAVPSSNIQSWRDERFNCEAVYSEAVPLNYATDRKAFAADYFPALRGISRTEAERAKNNNKRGNRFYNYLKTLDFNPSSSVVKTACEILSVQNTLGR